MQLIVFCVEGKKCSRMLFLLNVLSFPVFIGKHLFARWHQSYSDFFESFAILRNLPQPPQSNNPQSTIHCQYLISGKAVFLGFWINTFTFIPLKLLTIGNRFSPYHKKRLSFVQQNGEINYIFFFFFFEQLLLICSIEKETKYWEKGQDFEWKLLKVKISTKTIKY